MRRALLATCAALVLAAASLITSSAHARSGGGMGGVAATTGVIGGPQRGSAAVHGTKAGKGGKGGPMSRGTDRRHGSANVSAGQSRDAHAGSAHHAKSHDKHHISHRRFRNGGAFALALTPPYYAGYPYNSCYEWTQVRTPFGVRGMWVDICDY